MDRVCSELHPIGYVNVIKQLINKFIEMTDNSFLPDDMKRDFTELIKFRMSNLK